MYLDFEIVRRAVDELQVLNPFFGITFLVFKEARIPVGFPTTFEVNAAETNFLDRYYRIDSDSEHYFQPFRTSAREGRWLRPKYASSGLQSTRTRGDLAAAFFHEKKSKLWGWRDSYVQTLRTKLTLDKSGRIPAFWLAVWLFRNRDFPNDFTAQRLVEDFLAHFDISSEERDELFRLATPELDVPVWTELPYKDSFLLRIVEPAPDTSVVDTGSLRRLTIEGTGPVDLTFDPAERMSIITGDNGLGKSFLLDCSWWALTGTWPTPIPALPRAAYRPDRPPMIRYLISSERFGSRSQTTFFDAKTSTWSTPTNRRTVPGLTIYARVDGSFAVWDPIRHYSSVQPGTPIPGFLFDRDQIMNGDNTRQIEGLIRDWVTWQRDESSETFALFRRVLNQLSPPDMAPLEPGQPVRLAGDSRLIPTVKHSYGSVPVVHESAGVRRVIALAYLIVWAWGEHRLAADLTGQKPGRKLVILVDEVESHLHPKWQRSILPALLDVLTYLSADLDVQLIAATHSPLILASCETVFAADIDSLFHLSLFERVVQFRETNFVKYGTVDSWLTSDIFSLRQARSRPAEGVVERAREMMGRLQPSMDEVQELSNELMQVLPSSDELWVRWAFFASQKGVQL